MQNSVSKRFWKFKIKYKIEQNPDLIHQWNIEEYRHYRKALHAYFLISDKKIIKKLFLNFIDFGD